jgi:hypothetical protein
MFRRLAMGNVCSPAISTLDSVDLLLTPMSYADPLPDRPHPHYRCPKDHCLLRTTTEMERDRSIRRWHNPDPDPMASDRIPCGTVWYIRLVWGLLRDHRVVCGEHTCSGAIHTNGIGEDIRRAEECGIACLRKWSVLGVEHSIAGRMSDTELGRAFARTMTWFSVTNKVNWYATV